LHIANDTLIEDTEIRLLLEGLLHCYGFDFRDYEPMQLKRRIWEQVHAEGLETISGLQEKVIHDAPVLERFLLALSARPVAMFSDPPFYAAFRTAAAPLLRTYPSLNIWLPACSTGEEVYALAILLHEEGLLPRTRLYATDISEAVYRTAKEGTFPLSSMPNHAGNYRQAGGGGVISDYYSIEQDQAVMQPFLRDRVLFTEHSLATDGGFHEFELILCRPALPLFNDWLRERVHTLFLQSLSRFGILGVGDESAKWILNTNRYEEIGPGLYRKLASSLEG
jgi:chemotaxis protein methyltransferase CheR